ncbi:MAG: transketolase family protein [Candidatus Margulisbacteria bacterium]|nr:transketolase family protein [Candidatus Margulisiibacteriota bacterium]MBU1022566.1 transketolase family protein [Candidatus Margulisiibacteriota bacterium]MBU1728852.1 transketolase family protein [Candidatus Margulisiibacteriota bacterium]MBU1955483.1 transketolase family protein [Candidatus Margulisiibacteriota bacterium]
MAEEKLVSSRETYGKLLVELGKEYKNLVVLDADLSSSTKTCTFCREFPDRFINCGVAEQDMIGVAAGLAASGKIVFASTFAVFASGRAWDQVRVSVAYPRLNVKIVATHGGITTGEDGVTHQAMEDIAIMRSLPNLTVIVPADAIETANTIKALVKTHGPAYVRLNRPKVPLVYESENYGFKIGKALEMTGGKDLTIIACGIMVKISMDAAKLLQNEGISVRVINMHTIKPLDAEMIIKAAKETGAIVTAEEHSIVGGLGGAVAEVICENYPVPVVRVGMKDMFAESGKPQELLEKYGMTAKDVVAAAKLALSRKGK